MMFCSFALATLGVIGAVKLIRRLTYRGGCARWGYASWGPGDGCREEGGEWTSREGIGGPWGRHGFGGGPGRSFWLRRIFARLDTTPGQEREIRAAIEDFQHAARSAKDSLKRSRADLARAVAGDTFDEVAAAEAAGRADASTLQVKDAVTAALKRVHAVLDSKQRERLSTFLTDGPGLRRGGPRGPYRDAPV